MVDTDELKRRFFELSGARPASTAFLERMQRELGITLPSAFTAVCAFYDGSGIDVVPMYSLSGGSPTFNPLFETRRLRDAIDLPARWLVLAEPPESLIVMECTEPGRVLWLDAGDAHRLAVEDFAHAPDSWNSFVEFFSAILAEEEDERNE
jgi:hypothetical protein